MSIAFSLSVYLEFRDPQLLYLPGCRLAAYQSGCMGVPLPPCMAYGGGIVNANQQPAINLLQIDGAARYCDAVCEAVVINYGVFGTLRNCQPFWETCDTFSGLVRNNIKNMSIFSQGRFEDTHLCVMVKYCTSRQSLYGTPEAFGSLTVCIVQLGPARTPRTTRGVTSPVPGTGNW